MQTRTLSFFIRLKNNNMSLLKKTLKQLTCTWSNYCNKILEKIEIPVEYLTENIIPHKDFCLEFMGENLNDIEIMPSLKFLKTYKLPRGYIEFLDLIIIKNHKNAITKLRCGPKNQNWCLGKGEYL